MRQVLFLLMFSMIISGCTSVRTYTYRRDRVDQKVTGNQGVLQGDIPSEYENKGKRTLVGIDIETPLLPWQKQPQIEGDYSVDRPSGTTLTPKATPAPVRKAPRPKRAKKTIKRQPPKREVEEVVTVKGEVVSVKGESTFVEEDIILSDEQSSEWIK